MKDIMILGTYHMGAVKSDLVNGSYQSNDEGIETVVDSLMKFNPTKIAVEYSRDHSEHINSEYQKYLIGDFNLSNNEIHQIAFRLGKRLNLEKINCVDWNERVPSALELSIMVQSKMKGNYHTSIWI